jgi:hypothetical protein
VTGEYWHGTTNGYGNRRCRCGPCKDAHRVAKQGVRAERYAERVLVDGLLIHPAATHGRFASYTNYGCRCVPCTRDATAHHARLRARRKAA